MATYEKADGQTFLVFRCPVCGPSRRFLTEVELRRHVEHRHPWRHMPSHSLLPLTNDFDDQSSLTDSMSGEDRSPRHPLHSSVSPKFIPATTSIHAARNFKFSRDAYIDWLHSPSRDDRRNRSGEHSDLRNQAHKAIDNEIEFLNKRMEGLAATRKELARETLIMIRSLKQGPEFIDRMSPMERKRVARADAGLCLDDYMRGFRSRLDAVEKDALNLKSHMRGNIQNELNKGDIIRTTPHRPIAKHSNRYLQQTNWRREPLNRGYTSDYGPDSPMLNEEKRLLAIGNGRASSERDLELSPFDADRVFQWPPIYQTAIDSSRRPPHSPHIVAGKSAVAYSRRPPLSRDSSLTSTDNDNCFSAPSFTLSRRGLAIHDAIMNDPVALRMFNALHKIFRFLDTRSLARVGRVSKLWYLASRQSDLWTRVRIRRVRMTYGMLSIMTKWCSQVQELTLEGIRHSKSARQVPGSLESGLEKFLKANSSTLKIVRIINCGDLLSERSLWLVSVHCPKLESITYLSEDDAVGEEVICALKRGCPGITTLVIPPGFPSRSPDKFNDQCCYLIAQSWPMLQVLCIGGRNLTEAALSSIATNCPKIYHLELDHGPEISETLSSRLINQGLRGLEKLDFTFTPVSPRAIVFFLNACPKLEHIGVHVGISDYFPDHAETSSRRGEYKALVIAFEQLVSRENLKRLLDVRMDYG